MLVLLTISPLGKITRCDPSMLQISFPQSTEQVALATQNHFQILQGTLYLVAEEEL